MSQNVFLLVIDTWKVKLPSIFYERGIHMSIRRKFISMTICLAMLFTIFSAFSAGGAVGAIDDPIITPYLIYTNLVATSLSISGGVAHPSVAVEGYPEVTKITVTLSVEKSFLWWWNETDSRTQTFYASSVSWSPTLNIDGGGTYRAKSVNVVYCGSNYETVTGYSSNVSY